MTADPRPDARSLSRPAVGALADQPQRLACDHRPAGLWTRGDAKRGSMSLPDAGLVNTAAAIPALALVKQPMSGRSAMTKTP